MGADWRFMRTSLLFTYPKKIKGEKCRCQGSWKSHRIGDSIPLYIIGKVTREAPEGATQLVLLQCFETVWRSKAHVWKLARGKLQSGLVRSKSHRLCTMSWRLWPLKNSWRSRKETIMVTTTHWWGAPRINEATRPIVNMTTVKNIAISQRNKIEVYK